MQQRAKKILLATIRWAIAIVGIAIVVWNMNLRDSILLLDTQTNTVTPAVLARHAEEDERQFDVIDPQTGQEVTVARSRLVNPPTQKTVRVRFDGHEQAAKLLGMDLVGDLNRSPGPRVRALLIELPGKSTGKWIAPTDVIGGFRLKAPRPRVTQGISSMVEHAQPWLLALSLLVFPINYVITSYRWHKLLQAVEIKMGLARAFVINMVGAFFNTFLLGSTGGDVIKAYYAAKQTHHRTRAVMSVVIDRILGLLALVMLAGIMAAYQYAKSPSKTEATAQACLHVALVCVVMMVCVGLALAVLFQQTVRRWLGLEFILNRLPMQRQVNQARQVMRMYQRRPVLIFWALLITLPVHVTTIVSALLAGKAFGLPIQPLYYFTVVPVVVLVGSIPISPQGAGVMEGFAFLLMQNQSGTVNDAVALTMSIRLVQILWNLTGGIFVLRGGYHAPTQSEQREMEQDDQESPPEPAPASGHTSGT